MNTTPIPTVITVFHKYVVYLLLTSFLSHKTHFTAKADFEDDIIDDGYDLTNLSCVKCGFFKDSLLVVLLKKQQH